MRQDSGVLETVEMTGISENTAKRNCQLILGLAALYVLAFCGSFLGDGLVLAPQLDARENLLWAERIANGTVPAEPFYRALLYPLTLALATPEASRPVAGAVLGLLCHLIGGWLVWGIARTLWRDTRLPLFAVLLHLLNPASLFYALQLLDVTLAITLFLGALRLALRPQNRISSFLLAGLLGGLAVLARPHFLPAVLVLPAAAAIVAERRRWRGLAVWLPVLLLLLGQGFANQWHCGHFRILPWQGAYNLWAANKPGANGLYFKQSVDLALRGNDDNPTRAESIHLYGLAHPEESPPYPVDSINAFWRGKFLSHVLESPLQVAGLWLYKAYAVANSFEQYNNLTFSFHKERLPLLRYNPLNWGILFVLGSLGLLQLLRSRPRQAWAVLLIAAAYASMLILFYASARFRLPLVPLLAVLSAGSIGWIRGLQRDWKRLLLTIGVTGLTATLAFSSFGGIRNTDTYIQDRLLMANANADLGRDAAAAGWAKQVLAESPGRQEAQRIYAVSYFNLRLSGGDGWKPFGSWQEQHQWVRPAPTQDAALATVLAFYKWHWGDRETALNIWQQVAAANPDGAPLAQTALAIIRSPSPTLTPDSILVQRLLREE